VTGTGVGSVPKIDQIVELGIDDENYVSSFSSVSTVGASFGHEFFA
jgi:ABC-type enterochelin transport system substrate-binding protein